MLPETHRFHQLTMNRDVTLRQPDLPADAKCQIYRKVYQRFPTIDLGSLEYNGDSYFDLLALRQSTRCFGPQPLKLTELAYLLGTCRIIDLKRNPEKRTYPSAGGFFPIEIYVVSYRVENLLTRGAYHFNPLDRCLEELWLLPPDVRSEDVLTTDLAAAPAAFVLTAVLSRSETKYHHKAYTFAFLEAGHVIQNILLGCVRLGLGACPVGGFVDDRVSAALDLPRNEIPLCIVAVGPEVS